MLAYNETRSSLDYRWTQWVVFVLATLISGGAIYWATGSKNVTVECLGTQQIGIAKMADDHTIVTLPTAGSAPYALEIGPTCHGLKLAEKAFSSEGLRRVCVGNGLDEVGANWAGAGSASDCKITRISQLRAADVAELLAEEQ